MLEKFCNKRNPILPVKYHVPDSEAHVMADGNLYIYGSFDEREDLFCSDKYHVVSTSDMNHWTIHDVALTGQEISWFNNPDAPKYEGIDWTNPTPFIRKMLENMEHASEKEKFESKEEGVAPALLFAPDCIYKDDIYYLYFCMSDDSEGVATSTSPTGPFTNPIQLPCGGIDPAIFIDEDGSAYYYWGQLFSHGVQLKEDMVSFDESDVVHNLVTEEEHYFHEGSSMRKIGNHYYYVYTSIAHGKPTSLDYSIGKSPLGPFEYKGTIINNESCDLASWNNHGSMEQMDGQWYVFYHRSSRGTQLHRRLCIEPIQINEDGTIDEVKMTSQGIGDPFTNGEIIYGYQACELEGRLFIDEDGEGSEHLTNIRDGDGAIFRYVSSKEAFREVEIEAKGEGTIAVYLDEKEVGCVCIAGEKKYLFSIEETKGTNMELNLKFSNVKKLCVSAITLR